MAHRVDALLAVLD